MSRYRLVYFDSPGRGEITRMLFTLVGSADFEDKRVSRDQWESLKPTSPLKELPYLEVDGFIVAQSHAIERFVAREVSSHKHSLGKY